MLFPVTKLLSHVHSKKRGLIRKSQSRLKSSDSVWTNTAGSDLDEEIIFFDGASCSCAPPPYASRSHDDNAHALHQRVHLLERELEQKDEILSRLQDTAEAEERVRSERIDLLERQLERLVEMSYTKFARKGGSISLPSNQKNKREAPGHRAKMEISALQELLARMMAEKEQLARKNDNLKSLLETIGIEDYASCTHRESNMPSSISELDSIIGKESKMKKRHGDTNWQDNPVYNLLVSDNEYRHENSAKDGSPVENERQLVRYRMLCLHYRNDCPCIKYTGAYTTASTDRTREFAKVLKMHFDQVWAMVQENKGEKDREDMKSIICGEECYAETIGGFPSSPLARYLADHCKCFSSEEDMMRWCHENIKVERSKEKRSKSPLNHKKIEERDGVSV